MLSPVQREREGENRLGAISKTDVFSLGMIAASIT